MKPPPWARIAGLIIGHFLFWGWNLLFLAVLAMGLGPEILLDIFRAAWIGLIPPVFAITSAIILLVPVVAIIVGAWRFRSDPGRLLTLFYGIQAPIMFVAIMRLFAFQQLNAASLLSVGAFTVGAGALMWTVAAGPEVKWGPGQILLLIAQAIYGVCGLWVTAAMGLLTIPISGHLISGLFEIPLSALVFLMFAMVNAAVVTIFPLAMIGLSLRAWSLVHGRTRRRFGPAAAIAVSVGTVVAMGAAVTSVTIEQPQERAFALLEAADPAEASAHVEEIRRGLLEAHLWQYRYLSSSSLYDNIEEFWDEAFFDGAGFVPGKIARGVFAPFVYRTRAAAEQTNHRARRTAALDEARDASAAYAAFFDEPITRAERETILDAQQATWMWQDAAASILDVGQQRVWLEAQEIAVEEHGDHATIGVHDVYRNRTWEQREVVVYFSLPETAALTGLWLGHTADRDEAFHHVVAPRGAAQQVYREQVQTNRDPALLEQVGPRQYRLRAFPIEPRTGDVDDLSSVTETGPSFHLWMELQVLATPDDHGSLHWPLPDVAEIRNLYWDDASRRTVNGTPMSSEAWLPSTLPRVATAPLAVRQISLDGWEVRLEPATPQPSPMAVAPVVLIDTSRSMMDLQEEIAAALAQLKPEIVFCALPGRVVRCDFNEQPLFYGSISLIEALRALEGHADIMTSPDIVVLTDQGTYDQATDGAALTLPPLWLVHFDGLPLAYSDAVLDTMVNNGGGVGTSVDEIHQQRGTDGIHAGWRIQATPQAEMSADADDVTLHAIAAHAAIEARAGWSDPAALEDLDALHALAVRYDVVSPYSSMIVLVNDAQRQRLEELENADDRFEREAESSANAEEGIFDLTAVPEPEEWALMMLAAIALIGMRWRQCSDRL